MLRHKLVPLLLTTLIAVLPVGGIVSSYGAASTGGDVQVEAEAKLEAAGASVEADVVVSLPPGDDSTRPGAPTGLTATRVPGGVELRWSAPAEDGGAPILGYRLYREGPAGGTETTTGPATQALDANASPRALYRYTVAAQNRHGEGQPSNDTLLLPAEPPLAPHGLSARTLGGVVNLTWEHAEPETVVEFVVYMNGAERGRTQRTSFAEPIGEGETRRYHVLAVSAGGASAPSDAVEVRTLAPLSAPRDLVASGRLGAVDLAWAAPERAGEGALSYAVFRFNGSAFMRVGGTSGTSYTDPVPQKNATFRYHVRALDATRESEPSNEATAAVPGIPPTPFALRAEGGNAQVNLTWEAVEGARSYTLFRDGHAFATVVGLRHTDRPLAEGATHRYHAISVVDGEERRSVDATATTWSPPGAPASLAASAGMRRVELAWSAPEHDGGAAIVGYNVYRAHNGSAPRAIARTTNLTWIDTEVDAGTAYRYTVAAVSYREGAHSNAATATPLATPSAPRDVQASRGPGSIGLSWSAPASHGGSAILGYHVYELRGNATTLLASLDASTLSWRHAGLRDGETRTYTIAAFTVVGEGDRSAPVEGRTQSVPGKPQNVQAQVNLPSTATRISWQPPEDHGGTRITAYRIYHTVSGSTRWHVAEVSGSTYAWWDESCAAGTTCVYIVTAVNARGEGPGSDPATSLA